MSNRRPARLFLVRHGQVEANRDFRHVGQSDDPLTELGQEQAAQIGHCLGELSLSALYSSPLKRTASTAAKIAATTGLDICFDERLAERAYGVWEGMSRNEILERSPADRDLLERSFLDPSVAPPGGESLGSVQSRIVDLVEDLASRSAGESLVLVSHVGPIKALLAAALDVKIAQTRRLFLDPGTITVVDWGESPVLRLFNAHGHQGWARARWMA